MKILKICVIFLNFWQFCFSADIILNAFNSWITKYNKTFPDSTALNSTYTTFTNNYRAASRQQLRFYSGQSKFLMRANGHFGKNSIQRAPTRGLILDTDLDFTIGTTIKNVFKGRADSPVYPPPPPYLDYRQMGYVSSVQDQGSNCGSCYAFASNCALEGQIAKKYGILKELSEQNIVDCSTSYGNRGCVGGCFGSTFRYIINNPGVANDTKYPYIENVQECKYVPQWLDGTATAYYYVTGDENYLKSALAAIGPLAIGVRGDMESFAYYSSGIYDDSNCDGTINHAVCLIGYGTDNTTSPPTNYWIIKNSWSTDWGEGGYMRMLMGSNLCGISKYTVYPTV